MLIEEQLSRGEQDLSDADLHLLEALAVGADAEVSPAGVILVDRDLAREERLSRIDDRRREDGEVTREDAVHLLLGPANGGCRGDDLGAHPPAADAPRREAVDGSLVEGDHGAEGSGNEVQLVLDDQVGWPQRQAALRLRGWPVAATGMAAAALGAAGEVVVPVPMALAHAGGKAEEQPRVPAQGQLRELVDGPNDEAGAQAEDLLVDGDDRQPLLPARGLTAGEGTVAVGIAAPEQGASASVVTLHILPRHQLTRAPRAAE